MLLCIRVLKSMNYVRTMGSHSMRKYFLIFRTLYFMLHFVMCSECLHFWLRLQLRPARAYATLLLRLRINVCDAI